MTKPASTTKISSLLLNASRRCPEIVRLKRQLAERDEELAIIQKAATYFAKRLK